MDTIMPAVGWLCHWQQVERHCHVWMAGLLVSLLTVFPLGLSAWGMDGAGRYAG